MENFAKRLALEHKALNKKNDRKFVLKELEKDFNEKSSE